MKKLETFNRIQINTVNSSVAMAEELVSNFYKMSASQWLRPMYDIKTLADLNPEEIVCGPFAQIIRYRGQQKNTFLGSSLYDFYKICLQDHSILSALKRFPDIKLFAFTLYIITHELIHIVRFSRFLQNFDASPDEKMAEERRVHKSTNKILKQVKISGLPDVFKFYNRWQTDFDELQNS